PVPGPAAPFPPPAAALCVGRKRVERRLRRRNDLDVKALEQCARTEFGLGEAIVDPIEDAVRGLGRQALAHAEYLMKRVIDPDACRRSAKQSVVGSERAPDLA